VGSRAGLDAVAKRKIPSPCRESKPDNTSCTLTSILPDLLWFDYLGFFLEEMLILFWFCFLNIVYFDAIFLGYVHISLFMVA
jgi:hypothetical protein